MERETRDTTQQTSIRNGKAAGRRPVRLISGVLVLALIILAVLLWMRLQMTSAKNAQHPVFRQPTGETRLAFVTSDSGNLAAAVYGASIGNGSSGNNSGASASNSSGTTGARNANGSSGTKSGTSASGTGTPALASPDGTGPNPIYRGDGYVLGKISGTWHVLYHTRLIEGSFSNPLWFHNNGYQFAVLSENVAPGDWTGLTMQVVQIHSAGPNWNAQLMLSRGVNDAVVNGMIQRQQQFLLVSSRDVLAGRYPPTWISFHPNHVYQQPAQTGWPMEIPREFTYTIMVSSDTQSGSGAPGQRAPASINLQGDPGPIHMHIGDTLIVEESGISWPVMLSFSKRTSGGREVPLQSGDIVRVPSPYTQSLLYRFTKPFQGKMSFSVHFAGPNDIAQTGMPGVTLIVTK